MAETREKRIAARIDPELYERVRRVATEQYEGKESMALRALLREALDRREAEQREQEAA